MSDVRVQNDMKRTGGNEMMKRIAIGISQPNFKLDSKG